MMDILVAHDHRTAQHYLAAFGMPPTTKVITKAEHLRGYRPPTTFVYVNSDNARPDPEVVERLRILEACGCEVDWVGLT